jgi:predicted GIY-YIG superfamily endonuclease
MSIPPPHARILRDSVLNAQYASRVPEAVPNILRGAVAFVAAAGALGINDLPEEAATYMIACGDPIKCYYTGSTNNLRRRMHEHGKKPGSKFVRRFSSIALAWYVLLPSVGIARRFEMALKRVKPSVKKELARGDIVPIPPSFAGDDYAHKDLRKYLDKGVACNVPLA